MTGFFLSAVNDTLSVQINGEQEWLLTLEFQVNMPELFYLVT